MIIDNIHQLENLYGRSLFVYPVLQDSRRHRTAGDIIALVLVDTDTHEIYSIGKNHPDAVFRVDDFSFLNKCLVYSYDTILFNIVDCVFIHI